MCEDNVFNCVFILCLGTSDLVTFELSPDEMKGTHFTLDTNLLVQASALCTPPLLFTSAQRGF